MHKQVVLVRGRPAPLEVIDVMQRVGTTRFSRAFPIALAAVGEIPSRTDKVVMAKWWRAMMEEVLAIDAADRLRSSQ